MVRFVFCLALPEVIHLPHGLEAVTRNWRNHDSAELSAPQSQGEESDGAHCSTKRCGTFSYIGFYYMRLFSFPPNIFLSLSLVQLYVVLKVCSALQPYLTSAGQENLNLLRMSHSVSNDEEIELSKKYLQRQVLVVR